VGKRLRRKPLPCHGRPSVPACCLLPSAPLCLLHSWRTVASALPSILGSHRVECGGRFGSQFDLGVFDLANTRQQRARASLPPSWTMKATRVWAKEVSEAAIPMVRLSINLQLPGSTLSVTGAMTIRTATTTITAQIGTKSDYRQQNPKLLQPVEMKRTISDREERANRSCRTKWKTARDFPPQLKEYPRL